MNDSIQDQEIMAHQAATASWRSASASPRHPTANGNGRHDTRFGWKAQNKSITVFARRGLQVEMGIKQ